MIEKISPIAQFRSKVQWYLEGNTPQFSTELVGDLLVALKLLSADLKSSDEDTQGVIESFSRFCEGLSLRNLKDVSVLINTVEKLRSLIVTPTLDIAKKRVFRDAAVQLILVAESYSELSLKKSVLELSKSIK